jgi:2-keto-4-pentenoate hydratase/2-oxohepta-3-ene-1,7-dioic acid hydratase in catechol pathway
MRILRVLLKDGTTAYAEQHGSGQVTRLLGDPFAGLTRTSDQIEVAKTLAPVAPTAILCIGLNYRRHAEETKAPIPKFPVLFMKGINAVQNPGDPIVIPRWLRSEKVDFECELAVVIGKPCKNVTRANAYHYVLGYTAANDVSARDWQKEGGGTQWCRGKTFDTFAPLGPVLVTRDEIPDAQALRITTRVNNQVVQDSWTGDMIIDIPALIEFLSGSTTLLPGTVILTGTPHGVGMARTPPVYLKTGDSVTVEIESIGSLTNPVMEEQVSEASDFHLGRG